MEDLVGRASQSFAIPISLVFLPYESKEASAAKQQEWKDVARVNVNSYAFERSLKLH
jgi:hypothetical protein